MVLTVIIQPYFRLAVSAETVTRPPLRTMQDHMNPRGACLPLVQKFVRLNALTPRSIEVLLVTTDQTDLAEFEMSLHTHQLDHLEVISFEQLLAHSSSVDMFLSETRTLVESASAIQIPSATIGNSLPQTPASNRLVIAFDADGVLTNDSSEKHYQALKASGDADYIDQYLKHEQNLEGVTIPPGPFTKAARKLSVLRDEIWRMPGQGKNAYLNLALCTARNRQALGRMINTLHSYDIYFDHAFALGHSSKADYLMIPKADLFLDDRLEHINVVKKKILAGHVLTQYWV